MRLTTWLLILAAAPLPGVILALADLTLGLHGDAVKVFAALCAVAASALGTLAVGGFVVNRLRDACAGGRRSFAALR